MKQSLWLLGWLVALMPAVQAGQTTAIQPLQIDLCPTIEEADGSPSSQGCEKLLVTNDTLTNNGDGTFTLGESGDIDTIGDCLAGACFNALNTGTSLTFSNATSGTVTLQTVTGALGTQTIRLPATTGTLITTGDTGTVTGTMVLNDTVALSTDTSGNYVLDVADGTGIDGTANGEGATYTPTLDLTEVSSTTWGAGAFTTMTFDAGATDPVFTFTSGMTTIAPALTTTTLNATTMQDAVDSQMEINSSLVPQADNNRTLGSSSLRFNAIHAVNLFFDSDTRFEFDGTFVRLYVNNNLEQTWPSTISQLVDATANRLTDATGNLLKAS